jgi:hypothetical protein
MIDKKWFATVLFATAKLLDCEQMNVEAQIISREDWSACSSRDYTFIYME